MAKKNGKGGEDHKDDGHGLPPPIADLFGRIFMVSPETMKPVDEKRETKAFKAAEEVALKVAATLSPPKDQSGGVFIRIFDEKFAAPIQANPLIPSGSAKKLILALESKTGGIREQDDGPPRDELWGDVLHDAWFAHVAEHVAKELWRRLPGEPEEKEGMLEEMLPVLQKYGRAVFDTRTVFDANANGGEHNPLRHASECAGEHLKDLVIAKARELGVLPLA